MKYPKVWGSGPDTARIVGEARLRGLDQVGLPHLKASGPGFVAYKLGSTSEVHIEGEKQAHDEMLAVCFNSESNWESKPLRVERESLRRAFSAVKLSSPPESSLSGLVAAITYSGGGQLLAFSSTESLGNNWWRNTAHRSPDARRYHQIRQYEFFTDFHRGVSDSLPPGALTSDGVGEGDWSFGIGYRTAGVGAVYARYDYTTNNGATWSGALLGYGAGFDHGTPSITRWNPTQLMAVVPTYKSTSDSFGLALNENPHLTLVVRLDANGGSGAALNPGPLVSDFVNWTSHAVFNTRLGQWADGLSATPLVDQSMLVLVPSSIYVTDQGLPVALRLYRVGLSGGSELVTTFTTTSGYLPGYAQIGIGGPRIQTSRMQLVNHRPVFVARTEDPFAVPTLFVGDVRGVSWESRSMPLPQYCTGHIAAVSEKHLGCPMYDPVSGEYRLYVTSDFGVEWKPWARLSKNSAPPVDTYPVMIPYSRIHYVRASKFRPAPTYPGAEWVGNASVPIPVDLLL